MLLEGVKSTKMLLVLVKKNLQIFNLLGFQLLWAEFLFPQTSVDVTAELCVDSLTQQEKFKVHNPVKHSGLDTVTDLAENGLFINVTSSTSLGYS